MSSTLGSRSWPRAGHLNKDLRGSGAVAGWKEGGGAARSFGKFCSYPRKMV